MSDCELVLVYLSELSVFKDLSNIVSKCFMRRFAHKIPLTERVGAAEL